MSQQLYFINVQNVDMNGEKDKINKNYIYILYI